MIKLTIFCLFFLHKTLNFNRFTQKVMGLKSFVFCFGSLVIDLIFRLPAILMIMLNFKYQDELYNYSTPYLKNANLYFILLLVSTLHILTYFYIWSFKFKRDKPAKLIVMVIIIFGKLFLFEK